MKVSPAEAARILAARDPVIARLVEAVGPPRLRRPADSHFASLVRAVVYQQLAGRAAAGATSRSSIGCCGSGAAGVAYPAGTAGMPNWR